MTRALRTHHRRVFSLLVVALPASIAIALAARPAPAPPAPLGVAALDSPPAPLAQVPWQGRSDDGSLDLRARLGVPHDAAATTLAPAPLPLPGTQPQVLDLEVRSEVGQPETLLYWSAHDGGDAALPRDAVLLGPVDLQRVRRFTLPTAARVTPGALLLYRIAQGAVVARLPLPAEADGELP